MPAHPSFSLAPLLVALAVAHPVLVSCTPRQPNSDTPASRMVGAGAARLGLTLDQLAAREDAAPRHPVGSEAEEFTPDWVEGHAIAPLPPDGLGPDAPSRQSFATLLAALLPPSTAHPDAAATSATIPASLRLYASGRLKAADNDHAAAAQDFAEAARLDPHSAEPLRHLAQSQAAQGQRASSMATLRRAVSRGLTDPNALWLLGRDDLRLGKPDESLATLLRAADASMTSFAVEGNDQSASPVPRSDLQRLIAADLFAALSQSGRLSAAREVAAYAASPIDPATGNSRFRAEALELDRRSAELWISRGDLALRLRLPDEAIGDYARAANCEPDDPTALGLRLAVAFVRSGRPASAAQAIVKLIAASGGSPDARHLAALAQLASSPEVAAAVLTQVTSLSQHGSSGVRATGRVTRALAAGLDRGQAQDVLRKRLAIIPDEPQTLVALLELHAPADTAARADDLRSFARDHPLAILEAASAVTTLGRNLESLLSQFRGSADPTDLRLLAALTATSGDAASGAALLAFRSNNPAPDPATDLLLARLAASRGDWPTIEATIDRLNRSASLAEDGGPLARLLATHVGQRFQLAADLSRSRIDGLGTGAAAADLLLAADVARDAGRFDESAVFADRGLTLDPSDERLFAVASSLAAPDGPTPDAARFVALGRAARANVPGSGVIRLYQFRDLLARRQLVQAESMLRTTVEPRSEDRGMLDALADVWKLLGENNPAQLAPALDWITARRAGREDSPALLIAHARLLAALNRAPEAESLLVTALGRRPHPGMESTLVDLLVGPLGRLAEGMELLQRSIGSPPRQIEDAFIWANSRIALNDPAAAALAIAEIPVGVELSPPQAASLGQVLSRMAARFPTSVPAPLAEAVLAALDSAVQRGVPLPRPLHAFRLRTLCTQSPPDPVRIVSAVADASTLGGDARRAALGETLDLLLARDQAGVALRVMERIVGADEIADPDLVGIWLQLTLTKGTSADAERLVRAFPTAAPLRAILEQLDNLLSPTPTTDPETRAELAFVIGNEWTSMGREADALSMFRLALLLNADHGWAANNLGYALLESGRALPEAERWIEHAARLLPGEASVVDSLAWLRFKQGRLVDDAGPGAVTLLRRAIALPGGGDNSDLHDHLGDALFQSGHRADAIASWRTALDLISTDITRAQTFGAPPATTARLLESAKVTRDKLAAATAQQPPTNPAPVK